MTDHELVLGRGRDYADDPDLSPAARMAAIAQAYAEAAALEDDPLEQRTRPAPARDLHDILERAALEGRPTSDELLGTGGHAPEPPVLRCQRCGVRIALLTRTDPAGWERQEWAHVAGGPDRE